MMPVSRKKKTKRPVGRPPKFSTVEELQKAVDAFFKSLRQRGKPPEPPTLSGLCVHLDFADYSTFLDYEKKPAFSHVLKKARMWIRAAHERQLFGTGCTGSIFYLKCHGGEMFREQAQRLEHKVNENRSIKIEFVDADEDT